MSDEKGDDALGRAGADRIMRKITRYWRKRGHPGVNAWVEPVYSLAEPGDSRHGAYQVRSDMINGMPR